MFVIAVDFDGTIVDHCYPWIGEPVPGAFLWLKKFQQAGAKLILWTMRSDNDNDGPTLTDAVEFCESQGIEFLGVNENPTQGSWTTSPKAYANLYIDDAAFGVPLRDNPRMGGRDFVDWGKVGPMVMKLIELHREEQRVLQDKLDKLEACHDRDGRSGKDEKGD